MFHFNVPSTREEYVINIPSFFNQQKNIHFFTQLVFIVKYIVLKYCLFKKKILNNYLPNSTIIIKIY